MNVSMVPEYARIATSRLRLSSHNLRVETGQWSRTNRCDRVCRCNNRAVQDENHVLFECNLSAHVRARYPEFVQFTTMKEMFDTEDVVRIAYFCHEILRCYK